VAEGRRRGWEERELMGEDDVVKKLVGGPILMVVGVE
jgi:hypothetical protein